MNTKNNNPKTNKICPEELDLCIDDIKKNNPNDQNQDFQLPMIIPPKNEINDEYTKIISPLSETDNQNQNINLPVSDEKKPQHEIIVYKPKKKLRWIIGGAIMLVFLIIFFSIFVYIYLGTCLIRNCPVDEYKCSDCLVPSRYKKGLMEIYNVNYTSQFDMGAFTETTTTNTDNSSNAQSSSQEYIFTLITNEFQNDTANLTIFLEYGNQSILTSDLEHNSDNDQISDQNNSNTTNDQIPIIISYCLIYSNGTITQCNISNTITTTQYNIMLLCLDQLTPAIGKGWYDSSRRRVLQTQTSNSNELLNDTQTGNNTGNQDNITNNNVDNNKSFNSNSFADSRTYGFDNTSNPEGTVSFTNSLETTDFGTNNNNNNDNTSTNSNTQNHFKMSSMTKVDNKTGQILEGYMNTTMKMQSNNNNNGSSSSSSSPNLFDSLAILINLYIKLYKSNIIDQKALTILDGYNENMTFLQIFNPLDNRTLNNSNETSNTNSNSNSSDKDNENNNQFNQDMFNKMGNSEFPLDSSNNNSSQEYNNNNSDINNQSNRILGSSNPVLVTGRQYLFQKKIIIFPIEAYYEMTCYDDDKCIAILNFYVFYISNQYSYGFDFKIAQLARTLAYYDSVINNTIFKTTQTIKYSLDILPSFTNSLNNNINKIFFDIVSPFEQVALQLSNISSSISTKAFTIAESITTITNFYNVLSSISISSLDKIVQDAIQNNQIYSDFFKEKITNLTSILSNTTKIDQQTKSQMLQYLDAFITKYNLTFNDTLNQLFNSNIFGIRTALNLTNDLFANVLKSIVNTTDNSELINMIINCFKSQLESVINSIINQIMSPFYSHYEILIYSKYYEVLINMKNSRDELIILINQKANDNNIDSIDNSNLIKQIQNQLDNEDIEILWSITIFPGLDIDNIIIDDINTSANSIIISDMKSLFSSLINDKILPVYFNITKGISSLINNIFTNLTNVSNNIISLTNINFTKNINEFETNINKTLQDCKSSIILTVESLKSLTSNNYKPNDDDVKKQKDVLNIVQAISNVKTLWNNVKDITKSFKNYGDNFRFDNPIIKVRDKFSLIKSNIENNFLNITNTFKKLLVPALNTNFGLINLNFKSMLDNAIITLTNSIMTNFVNRISTINNDNLPVLVSFQNITDLKFKSLLKNLAIIQKNTIPLLRPISQRTPAVCIVIVIVPVCFQGFYSYGFDLLLEYGLAGGSLFVTVNPNGYFDIGVVGYASLAVIQAGAYASGRIFSGSLPVTASIQLIDQIVFNFKVDLVIQLFSQFEVGLYYQYLRLTFERRCWGRRWWRICLWFPRLGWSDKIIIYNYRENNSNKLGKTFNLLSSTFVIR